MNATLLCYSMLWKILFRKRKYKTAEQTNIMTKTLGSTNIFAILIFELWSQMKLANFIIITETEVCYMTSKMPLVHTI